MKAKPPTSGPQADAVRLRDPARSARLGKRLDPELKLWLDDVIVPALMREYLAEIKKRNQLASAGPSEVTSDKGR